MNTKETTPASVSTKRGLIGAYITIFILGWLLFPEAVAGLLPGFLLLDIGLRSPEKQ